MSLLKLYCTYHPDFMERLNSFTKINGDRLLKKLNDAQNKTAFLSTISEIKFGELFQKLKLDIINDYKIEKKTPDWTLNSSTLPIICEVYRLGKSNQDQVKFDFENLLKENLENIVSDLKLYFTIDYNTVIDEMEIEKIREDVKLWIDKKPYG